MYTTDERLLKQAMVIIDACQKRFFGDSPGYTLCEHWLDTYRERQAKHAREIEQLAFWEREPKQRPG